MIISKDFKEFLELLNKNGVKYLIVGGYAVAFHGHPRYTFEDCYKKRVEIEIDGTKFNFLDLENLKKNKRSTGRNQDLADLDNLE